ncbi:hypothetical protein FB451DRAFT_1171674 [Mycena latifolia]|nr:hypothetical protein FB451DRAFT_1171674 [Mycena latifolia]
MDPHQIFKTVRLAHREPDKFPGIMQIHVTTGEDPRASVLWQHLTGVFPYLCGKGIRIHYPELTLKGLTLANHQYVPLKHGPEDVEELKKLDSLARRCGLQLLEFHEDTVCSEHVSCPSVIRSTWNDSIFLFPFYDSLWGAEDTTKREKVGATWCLGPMDCKRLWAVPTGSAVSL